MTQGTFTAQPNSFDYSLECLHDFTETGPRSSRKGSLELSSAPHFGGSLQNVCPGSLDGLLYPSGFPSPLMGPLDPDDIELSSSMDNDHGSTLHAFEREYDLCRDYKCCGISLVDLHALVDHIEACHTVVQAADPYASDEACAIPPTNITATHSLPLSPNLRIHGAYNRSDDMDVDAKHGTYSSSVTSSGSDTAVTSSLAWNPRPAHLTRKSASHSICSPSMTAVNMTTIGPSFSVLPGPLSFSGPMDDPLIAQDACSYVHPESSTVPPNPGKVPQTSVIRHEHDTQVPTNPIHNSKSGSLDGASAPCRILSPIPTLQPTPCSVAPTSTSCSDQPHQPRTLSSARSSTNLSKLTTTLLFSNRLPCPTPNCNRSYKQANGLKYHLTHGSCDFSPSPVLKYYKELLVSRKAAKEKEDGGVAEDGLSDAEMREIEKEAERRLRPYACQVGSCQRRYKNMNGLLYHHRHSRDHGVTGLALLARDDVDYNQPLTLLIRNPNAGR